MRTFEGSWKTSKEQHITSLNASPFKTDKIAMISSTYLLEEPTNIQLLYSFRSDHDVSRFPFLEGGAVFVEGKEFFVSRSSEDTSDSTENRWEIFERESGNKATVEMVFKANAEISADVVYLQLLKLKKETDFSFQFDFLGGPQKTPAFVKINVDGHFSTSTSGEVVEFPFGSTVYGCGKDVSIEIHHLNLDISPISSSLTLFL